MGARLGAPHLRTVFVNVSGSFAIGFLAALGPMPFTRQLFMIGLLGGYTTFSAFSLQTLELAHEGKPATAGANVGLSVFLSLLAVTRAAPSRGRARNTEITRHSGRSGSVRGPRRSPP